ncbi:hypothetical protein NEOLEDRAFT_1173599, partial [Neolentinus lepideus HHB14362 ss-1]
MADPPLDLTCYLQCILSRHDVGTGILYLNSRDRSAMDQVYGKVSVDAGLNAPGIIQLFQVLLLFVVDNVNSAMDVAMIYDYTIKEFGNYDKIQYTNSSRSLIFYPSFAFCHSRMTEPVTTTEPSSGNNRIRCPFFLRMENHDLDRTTLAWYTNCRHVADIDSYDQSHVLRCLPLITIPIPVCAICATTGITIIKAHKQKKIFPQTDDLLTKLMR